MKRQPSLFKLCRAGLLIALLGIASPALAHPMGNFSIGHYARLRVTPAALRLRYVIDMAEISTFQETPQVDTDGDKKVSADEKSDYLQRKVKELASRLTLKVNGKPLDWRIESSDLTGLPDTQNSPLKLVLPTMRIVANMRAKLPSDRLKENEVYYEDKNFSERAGWKEIVVEADQGVKLLKSSAPTQDRSAELTRYPSDLSVAPPQDLTAEFTFALGEGDANRGAAVSSVSGRGRQQDAFTKLITTKRLSLPVILVALVVAFGFGAAHALSPGHGKTVVAAYLVGSRGTAAHAALLGVTVTISHTLGVFVLGLVTLFASRYILPERLYPWLGCFSGLTISAIGLLLLNRRVQGHTHDYHHHHEHDREHDHHGHHHHHHGHRHHHHHVPEGDVSVRQLLALGVSGGIVPCPSALVVLLGAIALHRIGFGLLLITAFSIGLAAVLTGIGLLMVYGRRLLDRVSWEGEWIQRLPVVSAAIMTLIGFGVAFQSLVSGGIISYSINLTH
jgi:ABC-type nickel/cobalt efflux system permease component RcnA